MLIVLIVVMVYVVLSLILVVLVLVLWVMLLLMLLWCCVGVYGGVDVGCYDDGVVAGGWYGVVGIAGSCVIDDGVSIVHVSGDDGVCVVVVLLARVW